MRLAVLVLGLAVLAAWVVPPSAPPSPRDLPGWALYDRYCLACHGASGDGRGPGAPFTRTSPRDLTAGVYKWRSTTGLPSDQDLRTLIRYGALGTSMPGAALSDGEIAQLIDVVKAFAPATWTGAAGTAITIPPASSARSGDELWRDMGCTSCHGNASLENPPYDLAREPLRRPRDPASDPREAVALSITTGLPGTAMPAYASLSAEDRWALAEYIVALNAGAKPSRAMSAGAIRRDQATRIPIGRWPASAPDESIIFGGDIAPMGAPPATLAPAQASLSAKQCARCHAKQFREWTPSLHAGATSPGLAAQMAPLAAEARASCMRCHAPLAEQLTDETLYADGASCAGCHVRNWTRHGPPRVAPSLLASPSYPLVELAIYERSDLCIGCHQLPPRTAVAGKPMLDTYREWLEGPYMPRGVQCQHCHMPNREHTFLGIHDPDTFRQAYRLDAEAVRYESTTIATARITNVGAGHYLPTTPTPAAYVTLELLDEHGDPIASTRISKRIGRDVYPDAGGWHEGSDTRIPPGEHLELEGKWPTTIAAKRARVTLEVHPDDYYERLYAKRLRTKLTPERKALYEQALARGRANHYIAESRDIDVR